MRLFCLARLSICSVKYVTRRCHAAQASRSLEQRRLCVYRLARVLESTAFVRLHSFSRLSCLTLSEVKLTRRAIRCRSKWCRRPDDVSNQFSLSQSTSVRKALPRFECSIQKRKIPRRCCLEEETVPRSLLTIGVLA